MRIDEITGALRTSDVMKSRAADSKCQVIVNMPPDEFLNLTTREDIRNQIEQNHLSLYLYNRFVKQEKSDVHPFLIIRFNKQKAKVVGHEGRHRAAALMKKGGNMMPVALCLDPERDVEDEIGMGAVYKVNFEHLPRIIEGQYGGSLSTDNWSVKERLWDQGRRTI